MILETAGWKTGSLGKAETAWLPLITTVGTVNSNWKPGRHYYPHERLTLTPTVSANYIHLREDSDTEQGAGALNLNVEGDSTNALVQNFGDSVQTGIDGLNLIVNRYQHHIRLANGRGDTQRRFGNDQARSNATSISNQKLGKASFISTLIRRFSGMKSSNT